MADPIVVSVEISGAEYIREFEVDPEEQLVKLLQRVADEEQIPLRKKSGHPLVWTAEGPDTREDHAGEWTELTRTQPLSRISEVVVERYGMRSPLFTIRFNIPGAGGFFVHSILNRDGFLLGGVVIVYCALLIVFNLLVDASYALLDRRIRVDA